MHQSSGISLSDGLAIGALVVSAVALVATVISNRRAEARASRNEARTLLVSTSIAYPLDGIGMPLLTIRAVNVGHRPVVVERFAFLLSDGNMLWRTTINFWMGDELPKRLEDGESLRMTTDRFRVDDATPSGVSITHLVVYDSTDAVYSAPFPLDQIPDKPPAGA
jgi:hypothetical protein